MFTYGVIKMDLDIFFQELKENLPDKAIDISESLGLFKETINDTMEAIAAKVNESIIARDLEKMKQYLGLVEQGHDYEVKIEEIIKMLDVEELAIKEEINENIGNKILHLQDTKFTSTGMLFRRELLSFGIILPLFLKISKCLYPVPGKM